MFINYRDSRPIYEQIKELFKQQILSGIIKKDEKLPSVRDVATELAINPNTIQRAYRDLETEGYIYSVAGKGSFAEDSTMLRSQMQNEIIADIRKNLQKLKSMGIQKEVCMDIIREIYEAE